MIPLVAFCLGRHLFEEERAAFGDDPGPMESGKNRANLERFIVTPSTKDSWRKCRHRRAVRRRHAGFVNMPLTVRCPTCRAETNWENNPHRPFCSERCQLIDLDALTTDKYRVPAQEVDFDAGDDEDDENDPLKSLLNRMTIHPTAVIDLQAEIEAMSPSVPTRHRRPSQNQHGSRVMAHAYLTGWTEIGSTKRFIQARSSARRPRIKPTRAKNLPKNRRHNTIREHAQIHRGTAPGSATIVVIITFSWRTRISGTTANWR